MNPREEKCIIDASQWMDRQVWDEALEDMSLYRKVLNDNQRYFEKKWGVKWDVDVLDHLLEPDVVLKKLVSAG